MPPRHRPALPSALSGKKIKAFLADANLQPVLQALFEGLPDVLFFTKNRHCEIMDTNKVFSERMGARNPRDLWGKRSIEMDPLELARTYEEDDLRVMSTGKPMENHLELNRAADGSVNWFVTSKYPLKSRRGKVIGLFGFAYNIEKSHAVFGSLQQFNHVINWIHKNLSHDIRIQTLAKMSGTSRRAFEKRFRQTFRISPAQYVIRARLSFACERLRLGQAPLSVIAQESGFYDQSAFNRAFLKYFGCTPRKYRQQNSCDRKLTNTP